VVAEIDRSMIRDMQGQSLEGEPMLALPALVKRGLSAQLAQQSLLTGLLYVDLDLRPGTQAAAKGTAPPRSVPALGAALVEIPTTRSRVQSLQDQLEGVDLARMAQDLAGTLAAARELLAGPALRQALAEMSQAASALARLGKALEARVAPLADGAQQTLVVAGQAAERVSRAADRTTAAADRVNAAAARADTLLTPGSPLLASVQRTADELARSAAALRQAVAEDSATLQGTQQALDDVARAARAVRELAAQLEQQPQMLLLGRPGGP
jgi:paraquat-inducible protein B